LVSGGVFNFTMKILNNIYFLAYVTPNGSTPQQL